ncbi:uncharacterized protein [Acropora muricata]|uniref:uncharacterized protein isoform X2 n=1 Tax=Acropora muricata TaxID=159855 RepID=UPI0034E41D0F
MVVPKELSSRYSEEKSKQEESFSQSAVVNQRKAIIKEKKGSSSERNGRKRRNRNKSISQGRQEIRGTDFNQNFGKVFSKQSRVPDVVVQDSVTTTARCSANVWQRRKEKQEFLAELQPCNEDDEEMQLRMALELSRQQGEIDAQQREINILEKQMEETLQIERELQLKASHTTAGKHVAPASKTNSAVSDVANEPFPALPFLQEESDIEDEWVIALGGEEQSDDNEDADHSRVCLVDCGDDTGGSVAQIGDNITLNGNFPKLRKQSPQQQKEQDTEPKGSCPFGRNCCLGKRCKYSHPPSTDTRKRCITFEQTSSQDLKALIHDRNDESESGSVARIGDNVTLNGNFTKLRKQSPKQQKEQDTEAKGVCPFGKNCCLGKRCKSSHPPNTDTRKTSITFEQTSSQDLKTLIHDRNDESETVGTLERKPNDISMTTSSDSPMSYDLQGQTLAPPSHVSLSVSDKKSQPLDLPERTKVGFASSCQSISPGMLPLNDVWRGIGGDSQHLQHLAIAVNPQSTVCGLIQFNSLSAMSSGPGAMLNPQTRLITIPMTVPVPHIPMTGFSGVPLQPSILMPLTDDPQSLSLKMTNLSSHHIPFTFPHTLANTNTDMSSMVVPNLRTQESCQTKESAGLPSPTSKIQKPAKGQIHNTGVRNDSSGSNTEAPLLRRPATMPKVMQHRPSA